MLLLYVLACIGIPLLAVSGKGHRGLYASIAMAAFVFGCTILWMGSTSANNLAVLTTAQQAGTQFIQDYFPAVGTTLVAIGSGALLGTVTFRRPRRLESQRPSWPRT
jgi:hypothetical protein